MANRKREPSRPAEDTPEVLAAKNEALQDELRRVDEENARLRGAQHSATVVTTSPEAPARPVVTLGGAKYQFKMASFRIGDREVFAAEVAEDPARLLAIFEKYPGLFAPVN